METFIVSVIAGVLTAFFGWTGGRGDDYWKKHPKWPRWLLQSWTRDWLIGPVCALAAMALGVQSWWLLLLIPATALALSTYWDWLFGFDNFFMHGLFVGLMAFPLAIATGSYEMFIMRSILLSLWMGIWSGIFDNVHIEESGRYAIVGSTIFMIC